MAAALGPSNTSMMTWGSCNPAPGVFSPPQPRFSLDTMLGCEKHSKVLGGQSCQMQVQKVVVMCT